ncbi:amidase [Cupriavidus pauculus]|uniref:amidase n=1 Tax=Cupriavidus pauculus TaxID=82633 RepID=UPI001EE3508C|nr:amidase [Cupriavidus pauculus]GJG94313.1 amidase [Cupriavidus pauculus]
MIHYPLSKNHPTINDLLQPGYAGAFVKEGFGALPFSPTCESRTLAGLTLAVKDVFNVRGLRTGAGNPEWQKGQSESTYTADAVDALLRAGATWLGKTVTDELAFSLAGNNIHYGTPTNPASPMRIPGGSSSGSAVAVAGGYADIGLATDCGGSARLPGSYCGVWGIRPSHGLIGGVSGFPLAPSFDTVGWFSRTGDVMAQVLEILAPHACEPRDFKWAASYDALEVCEPRVGTAYRMLVDRLTTTDVTWCAKGSLPVQDWAVANRLLQGAEVWSQHGEWVKANGDALAPVIRDRFISTSKIETHQLLAAEAVRKGACEMLQSLFENHGVLIVPTAPGIAPLLTSTNEAFTAARERSHMLLAPAGLAGLPQITLPWLTLDGAPVGISVLGPRGHDRSVMAAARKLEAIISTD